MSWKNLPLFSKKMGVYSNPKKKVNNPIKDCAFLCMGFRSRLEDLYDMRELTMAYEPELDNMYIHQIQFEICS